MANGITLPPWATGNAPVASGKAASLAANEKPSTGPEAPRIVNVKAHTRTLAPKVPVNTQQVEPASQAKRGTSQRFYTPPVGSNPSKPDGYESVHTGPRGRAGIGAPVKSRPYWVASRGSGGDTALAGLTPAARASVAQQHAANTTVLGNILEKTVHPVTDLGQAVAGNRHITVGGAASDIANIASNLISPEKVGAAAGLFGLRGLRGLKAAQEGASAADATQAASTGFRGARHADIEQQIAELHGTGFQPKQGFPSSSGPMAAAKSVAPTGNGVQELRDALSGKSAFAGMGKNEKAGALIDDPLLGSSAGKLRNQQSKLQSVERGARIAKAEQVMNEVGGVEGHQLALKALKGELPKLKFTAGKDLNPDNIPALFQHIQDHPDLRPYERLNTRNALIRIFDGQVPRHFEIKLLSKVFGENDAKSLVQSTSLWKKLGPAAGELLNVPRAVMSSFDLSAPFRQGLVAGTTHPVLFAKNFKPMLKAFKSEGAYQAIMDDIVSRPTYDRMKKAGLGITDLEGGLSTREEQWFGENMAEKIPIAGHGIRASGRAYTGFLSKMRADVFDSLLSGAEKAGRDPNDEKMLHDIAKAVNSATGRGSGPKAIQSWLPALNSLFFSPRLLFSRLDYLNPVNYTKLDPIARKEYLKGSASLLGTVGTVLTLAKLSGAQVNMDPLSADFAKIKIGNTRIDILGGFQQPVRLLAQLASGKIVSSTTGKTLNLGPQGPGHLSRFDIGLRFVESKLAPVPSFVTDVSKGTQFGGQKLNWGLNWNNPVFQRMLPLLLQDSKDIFKSQGGGAKGLGAAAGAYGLGAFGVGLQTYGATKKKTAPPTVVPSFASLSKSSGSSKGGVTLPPWAH